MNDRGVLAAIRRYYEDFRFVIRIGLRVPLGVGRGKAARLGEYPYLEEMEGSVFEGLDSE